MLRGAGAVLAVPVSLPARRVAAMASDKKAVLVPIGNGSEEMEAVICEAVLAEESPSVVCSHLTAMQATQRHSCSLTP